MKKLALQSIVLSVSLVILFILCRLIQGNAYTAYIPMSFQEQDPGEFHIEEEEGNPGRADFDPPVIQGNYVALKIHPRERGRVGAILLDAKNAYAAYSALRVGPFMTVHDLNTGGFTGDTAFLIFVTLFFLGEGLLMFLAFRRAKGPDFYSYFTIYTAGFSIFLILTGLQLGMGALLHLLDPMSHSMLGVYSQIATAGYSFMQITFPLVAAFSVALTVSNIELLRHERRRLANVLGILISLVLVLVPLLGFFLFGGDFAGSEREYRILQTLMSTYSTIFVYFECMLLGSIICGLLAARHVPEGPCDYIVILGCGFRKDGTLPPLLRGRVDEAIGFWKRQKDIYGKDVILVPSGGQGRDEVMPEGEAMQRYLLSQNVPSDSIMPELKSANTYQNMQFSKKLIEERTAGKEARVIFSTTNYHVFRSGVWASLAGLKAEGIGSPTKWWFWPNAFIREWIGLISNRWKQELLLMIILTAFFAGLSMIRL